MAEPCQDLGRDGSASLTNLTNGMTVSTATSSGHYSASADVIQPPPELPNGGFHVVEDSRGPQTNGVHNPSELNGGHNHYTHPGSNHVIKLSGLEHCMARSYIRMCLAYRLPNIDDLPQVVERLNNFVRKTVDAKPYLSGWVVAAANPGTRHGLLEIRFSDSDFLEYQPIGVRHLSNEEVPFTYEGLCEASLPPSTIRPDLISALGESADEARAPVFRVQINVVDGGIIVAWYLHHCMSDGTGIDLLISGSLLDDAFTFHRDLDGGSHDVPSLSMRLEAFAKQQSHVRNELSWSDPNQINTRRLKCRTVLPDKAETATTQFPGRGIVFSIPLEGLITLKMRLKEHNGGKLFSRNDTLMALIWHSMTRARIPSLAHRPELTKSRLNIPVNIRNRLKSPLPESYFGSAVDFGSAELSLAQLADSSDICMSQTVLAIRDAILSVDEPYIRQAIALAMYPNPDYDVRDLQGSNMDRAEGADMYITSWEKLQLYEAECGMGLGKPDWVRKPWSRDPGSCIVYPQKPGHCSLEVVIQMTAEDMQRLLADEIFMGYVSKWIE